MNGAILSVMAGLAAIAIVMHPGQPASAQTQQLQKVAPSGPSQIIEGVTDPQKLAPQRQPATPDLPQKLAPSGPLVVFRTYCNGTCGCTGIDCTKKWKDDNCKADSTTCSGTGGVESTTVCSCIKKAAPE